MNLIRKAKIRQILKRTTVTLLFILIAGWTIYRYFKPDYDFYFNQEKYQIERVVNMARDVDRISTMSDLVKVQHLIFSLDRYRSFIFVEKNRKRGWIESLFEMIRGNRRGVENKMVMDMYLKFNYLYNRYIFEEMSNNGVIR